MFSSWQKPVATTTFQFKLLHSMGGLDWQAEGRWTLCFASVMLGAKTQSKLTDGVSQMSNSKCEDADHITITILLLVFLLDAKSKKCSYFLCIYANIYI